MGKKLIFSNPDSSHRGGGRYARSLLDVIDGSMLISDLGKVNADDVLIIPFWKYIEKPIVNKKYCRKQILCILDVIPLKYPNEFPLGIKGKFNLWRNKRSLKYFDKIVTISHRSKSQIIKHLSIDEAKIEVIYPTLEPIFWQQKISSTTNQSIPTKDFFLYVGDANWNKNLVNLARAIKQADVHCVFVGKIFERLKQIKTESELTKYLSELHHIEEQPLKDFTRASWGDERFHFAGFVSDEKLIELYDTAITNILVSYDEGFGYSFFEAGARGCPSILSDTPIFREVAYDASIFVNPDDWQMMATKLYEFEKNPIYIKKLGILTKARTQYLLEKNKIQNDWEKLISEGR